MSTRWLDIARKYSGTREVHGPQTSPVILRWLISLGAWWRDDETPWCGVFAGAVLKEAGMAIPKAYYRASAWADWGVPLNEPVEGCIVTFSRQGGGHVGFVVGQTTTGALLVLGGNQGDEVNVRAFQRARATAYRWPSGEPMGSRLPILAAVQLSTSEA